jgi:hypothetical protein
MKILLNTSCCLLVSLNFVWAGQLHPVEKLFIPWGSDPGLETCFSIEPDGRYGPQSFRVVNDSLWILDNQNRLLKQFEKTVLTNSLPVSGTGQDFLITGGARYFYLAENTIVAIEGKSRSCYSAPTLPRIERLFLWKGQSYGYNSDGNSLILDDDFGKAQTIAGLLTPAGLISVRKISRQSANLTIQPFDSPEDREISLTFEPPELGSIRLLGADRHQRIYLDLEFIRQDIPLLVEREIQVLDSQGSPLVRIHIPMHYYTAIYRDLELSDNDEIYQMLSSEDGIRIFEWIIPTEIEEPWEGIYPAPFTKPLHYNLMDEPEPKSEPSGTSTDFPIVTRNEALAIGDSYVQHVWFCTAANISNGTVQAPDGDLVRTPDWIQLGYNQKIPYMWGGFNTLTEYDAGMTSGMYAGDIHTDGVSSYARGADCSGFVSRCWKLPYHYSTRMMDDAITIAYSSWEELKPGDAIHRPGHVRMAVNNNPTGTILAVESAGTSTGWKVDYRSYSYSDLYSYLPRYYINMIGSPVPLAQPVLRCVSQPDSIHLVWDIPDAENVDGIKVYHSLDGQNWSPLFIDSLIALDNRQPVFWQSQNTPHYFQLTAVHYTEEVNESLPSDAYGTQGGKATTAKVLIVDGFDRYSGTGSWAFPYHEFALQLGDHLASLGLDFDTADNDAVLIDEIELAPYNAVFWILGDESTQDETFSTDEQNLVKNYLYQGGQLFVSGSEVAWDLDYSGSADDRAFFTDYLKASYVQDNAEVNQVNGLPGCIFSGRSFTFDDGSYGIYNEDYPDVILPAGTAQSCLQYSNGLTAGIQYEGVFPDGSVPGRLVYIAFPWETLVEDTMRQQLLAAVAAFFELSVPSKLQATPPHPTGPFLSAGYPNPFNNEILFDLEIPVPTDFTIIIYNSRGQRVRRIDFKTGSDSRYTLHWDGCNDAGKPVASGTYFFTIKYINHEFVRKIVYLK